MRVIQLIKFRLKISDGSAHDSLMLLITAVNNPAFNIFFVDMGSATNNKISRPPRQNISN